MYARAAVGLGPGASEQELRAAEAAVHNPELLGLLKLPADAAAWAVRSALNKPDQNGNLPVHRALCDVATSSPELVGAMLDAGGEAMLGVPGLFKRLPLHYAAAYKSQSPAVVALLLARGPAGAARAKDVNGRTPLWHAEQGNDGPGAAEIGALLRAAKR
jgi:hypothetical protein